MQSIEQWLPVVGYESSYEVSDQGRVRSLDRIRFDGYMLRSTVLSPSVLSDGRRKVNLWRDGRQTNALIHKLVLQAFVGPRPQGMEGCHGDGDLENNKLANLRWATKLENMDDRRRHGTHNNTVKTHCPQGHALVLPNLVLGELRNGGRKCRACNQAHAYAQKHGSVFSQSYSDNRYQVIMAA
jgi:hypothetical protein